MSYVASCILTILSAYYGLGRRDDDISDIQRSRALQYFVYWQLVYSFAIVFVKASICATLLRLTTAPRYRYTLHGTIVLMGVCCSAGVVTILTSCKPISALWTGQGTCASTNILGRLTYVLTALAIITDIVCLAVPWLLLRQLQMSARKRFSLTLVLGLGLLASIGSVIRIPYISAYAETTDVFCE